MSQYDAGSRTHTSVRQLAAGSGGVGPLGDPLPDIRRIAVLRGGGLGDLLFAVPALYALAAAYPRARITLLGSAAHAALLSGRPGPVHDVLVLPATHTTWDEARHPAEDEFVERVRRERVDLGVQLHGGGAWSNPFLRQLEPRFTVGPCATGAAALTRNLPFRYYQHEVLRWLEVAGLAGAPPVLLEPRIELTAADVDAAAAAVRGLPGPIVTLHPGATDGRRRWPAADFAAVAAYCLRRGLGVVIVGVGAEGDTVARIDAEVRAAVPAELARDGLRTLLDADMSTLCGVLARSRVVIGNDSGPRHLAAAVGTPTIGIYWIGNVVNAGPLGRGRHRVLISWTTRCPVCGQDVTDETLRRCPHDESFVAAVPVARVRAELDDLLATGQDRAVEDPRTASDGK
ncbi:glycosyltransferase family 9 protein [Nocardia otitidiscaviarum]|uniref:glycosyltransferase family 9 protein n=1 Tax=Nocardia otitidiscaviarum TaxID=1823 RepID=UPI0009E008FC|nr:glycosyltransferase family 9 protein [Nocardia otitidiscaviarum]MBF6135178.1 glycosyltransferase family 9 protein [Nocardia otitidiscaviarum]MBF6486999.1 glycosyltransferase family 9 protein [Nocardia otitidiscaviarum]